MVHNNPSKKRAGPLISGGAFWYFFLEGGGIRSGCLPFPKKQGNHLQHTNPFDASEGLHQNPSIKLMLHHLKETDPEIRQGR